MKSKSYIRDIKLCHALHLLTEKLSFRLAAKPDKRIFLHCGLHKTGTTSLQRFLHSNRSLLTDSGYAYPKSGLFSYAHHNLAWELVDDERFSASRGNIAELLREISCTHQHVILSSEDFEGCIAGTAAFHNFTNDLKRLNLRPIVIVYLRSQDCYASSLYFQLLQHGYNCDFSEFIDEIIATGSLKFKAWRFWFDYEQLIRLLRKTGCEHWVQKYSEIPRTDIVRDFCGLLGINTNPEPISYQDHPRIDLQEAYSHFLKNTHFPLQDDEARLAGLFSFANQQVDIGVSIRRRLAACFNRKNRILKQYFEKPFEIYPYSRSESNTLERVFSRTRSSSHRK
jgi:hypothetical protein